MQNSTLVRLAIVLLSFSASAANAFAADDDIVLYARSATRIAGAWSLVADPSAAGGQRLANPDAGAAKVGTALAAPANYFEVTFTAAAGRAYHLWIRGKAQNDAYTNDSAFVQFSGSLDGIGRPVHRIGTSAALIYILEDGSGMGERGWGWQDTGYGVLGEPIYFDGTTQRVRIQTREDGLSIDQIVLSPVTYAARAPGAAKDDATILIESSPATTAATTTTTPTTTTTTTPTTTATPTAPSSSTAVAWTNTVNTTSSGGTLKKTSGCGDCYDAGAISQQQIASGSISFSVATGQSLFVGLGRDMTSSTAYTIDYAFKFTGGASWEVREANQYRTEGVFAATDVFSIAVTNGSVKYYRNGALVYTSQVPAATMLVMDASMSSIGATVTAASISGSTTATTAAPAPAPAPGPTATTSTLRVLQWNIHHGGYGTDGVYSPDRVATWAANFSPDVILFNEIERNTYWGNQDQPEVYKTLLQQKTGRTWYYVFAQEYGNWSANGKGNMILSTYPIQIADRYELVHNADRSIAMGTIAVNGRMLTLLSTHLDPYDATLRLAQARDVTGWASVQPENRILGGDMNAWPDQASILHIATLYNDSWAVAAAQGKALAFSGNTGETRSGRIDYIFYSKNAGNLQVVSSQVYDTRDANGVMPSDHRPVLTTFEVR